MQDVTLWGKFTTFEFQNQYCDAKKSAYNPFARPFDGVAPPDIAPLSGGHALYADLLFALHNQCQVVPGWLGGPLRNADSGIRDGKRRSGVPQEG